MTSTVKVNNVQASDGGNIINQCGTNITIGASGDTIALASGASQTGFGREGSVDWQTTIKTGDFTAVSGEGYFINTTSGAITMTLPSSPSAGAIVSFSDYANTFDTDNLTVGRNGSNIGGSANNATVTLEGLAATLVYADATKGWIVTDSGLQSEVPGPEFVTATGGTITTVCTNYKVHTFTGPGTFTVCNAGNSAGSNTVSYMVVAAGGGGGTGAVSEGGGGGGAGGFRESKAATDSYTASPLNATSGPGYNLPVGVQGYPIVVGAGGSGGSSPGNNSTSGGVSSFSTITSAGGGQAGGQQSSPAPHPGTAGGSGGGAINGCGAAGNTPPTSPAQGTAGGNSASGPKTSSKYIGSGGGGATAVGLNTSSPTGKGCGGAGATTSINGTPTVRAGGGGGGYGPSGTQPYGIGAGGTGGGGGGGPGPQTAGNAGTVNTGGGGGGGSSGTTPIVSGGAGGSGIVIIRYKFQ
tara:strand:+ start:1475 stop:2878 length:1404 start_codon:yes stop_codon:yes gene_type:complete